MGQGKPSGANHRDAQVLPLNDPGLSVTSAAQDAVRRSIRCRYGPAPIFVGVTQPINAYTIDYMLFTNARAKNDVVLKIVDTLAKNKPDLVAVAPHLSSFNPAALYKRFDMPYHPGALKYFADHNMRPVGIR